MSEAIKHIHIKIYPNGRVLAEDWEAHGLDREQVLVGRTEFMEYLEDKFLKYGVKL